MLFLLLLLSVGTQSSGTQVSTRGDILVRIEPGITVLLDGEAVGISSVRDNGLWIREVRPGKHKLTFQTTTGSSIDADVEVFAGQTTPVQISSLTLRASARKRKSDLEVRVESDAPECMASLGDRRESITSPRSVVFEDAPTGSQRVSVSCAGRTLNTNVEIGPGRRIVVAANFQTKSIRVAEDKTRVKELVVKSGRDLLAEAPIPANAKRAIIAALTSKVDVLGSFEGSQNTFIVRLEANYPGEITDVASRLMRSGQVRSVKTRLVEEIEKPRRVRMDVIIQFGTPSNSQGYYND